MSNQLQFLPEIFYIRLLKTDSSTLSEYFYKQWCEIKKLIWYENHTTPPLNPRDNEKSVKPSTKCFYTWFLLPLL